MLRFTHRIALGSALFAIGCSGAVDVADIPVGADVQVTRDDGGFVEGTLQARDEETVTVKVARSEVTREIPVEQIAEVQVVDADVPAPEPPPIARFREVTVPAGTTLQMTLRTAIDTGTTGIGDPVEAVLAEAVMVDGFEALPAGSVVRGQVTSVTSSGKVKGRASIAIAFDRVAANDESHVIAASLEATAPSTKENDAKKIGLGAVGGAVLGAVIGGKKGAAIGATIGGGAGTAAALMTEGGEIRIADGAALSLELRNSVDVKVPIVR